MTLVYATQAYRPMAHEVCAHGGFELAEVERKTFEDGERYLRLASSPNGRHTVVLGGTIGDADTLELYDLACAAVEGGARSLTLMIPYFGYSTQERMVRPREVVAAKTRARVLSSIPIPGGGSRVLLLDLHAEGLPYYFDGALRPIHLYAKPLVIEAARALSAEVLASTDAGRAKWVESLASDLHLPAAFVIKRRSQRGSEVIAIAGDVAGKQVVIYDDLVRSGGSLLGAARAYREAGARSVSAIVTHGVLPGDAVDRLAQSGLLTKLVVTDSHPRARELSRPFLEVIKVAKLLSEHVGGG